MKRKQFIKHLIKNSCELYREGSKHSVYVNRMSQKTSTIPRHQEINNFLVKKICKDLEIPSP